MDPLEPVVGYPPDPIVTRTLVLPDECTCEVIVRENDEDIRIAHSYVAVSRWWGRPRRGYRCIHLNCNEPWHSETWGQMVETLRKRWLDALLYGMNENDPSLDGVVEVEVA